MASPIPDAVWHSLHVLEELTETVHGYWQSTWALADWAGSREDRVQFTTEYRQLPQAHEILLQASSALVGAEAELERLSLQALSSYAHAVLGVAIRVQNRELITHDELQNIASTAPQAAIQDLLHRAQRIDPPALTTALRLPADTLPGDILADLAAGTVRALAAVCDDPEMARCSLPEAAPEPLAVTEGLARRIREDIEQVMHHLRRGMCLIDNDAAT